MIFKWQWQYIQVVVPIYLSDSTDDFQVAVPMILKWQYQCI